MFEVEQCSSELFVSKEWKYVLKEVICNLDVEYSINVLYLRHEINNRGPIQVKVSMLSVCFSASMLLSLV